MSTAKGRASKGKYRRSSSSSLMPLTASQPASTPTSPTPPTSKVPTKERRYTDGGAIASSRGAAAKPSTPTGAKEAPSYYRRTSQHSISTSSVGSNSKSTTSYTTQQPPSKRASTASLASSTTSVGAVPTSRHAFVSFAETAMDSLAEEDQPRYMAPSGPSPVQHPRYRQSRYLGRGTAAATSVSPALNRRSQSEVQYSNSQELGDDADSAALHAPFFTMRRERAEYKASQRRRKRADDDSHDDAGDSDMDTGTFKRAPPITSIMARVWDDTVDTLRRRPQPATRVNEPGPLTQKRNTQRENLIGLQLRRRWFSWWMAFVIVATCILTSSLFPLAPINVKSLAGSAGPLEAPNGTFYFKSFDELPNLLIGKCRASLSSVCTTRFYSLFILFFLTFSLFYSPDAYVYPVHHHPELCHETINIFIYF
eukprot:m.106577 g.106577  ORF g.106577 m.106577 type:complete len:425 (+) comp13307_c0_seq4:176-1450(+)